MATSIKVLLVDDQALVRSGFAMVLSIEDDIDVVGQAANGAEAIEQVRRLGPDVVLMDVQMPEMDGIAATKQITAEDLAKVVILTTFDRDDYLFDALAAGASGFLLKNAQADDLVSAIRSVASGQALLSPEVTLRVIERFVATDRPGNAPAAQAHQPSEPLTARELDVLALLSEGMSNSEIAAELFVGEATVKTHLSHVLAKIGARDRVQAVVYAHRAGLTRPGHHAN